MLAAKRLLANGRPVAPLRAFSAGARLHLPKTSKVIVLQNPPTGPIDTSNTSTGTFALSSEEIRELRDGEALVETICISNDPAQRFAFQAWAPPTKAHNLIQAMDSGQHER